MVVIEDEVVVAAAGEGVTMGPFINGASVDPGVGSREVLLTSAVGEGSGEGRTSGPMLTRVVTIAF